MKNILPLRSIVDFGCGTGTWLLAAENLGFKELEGYEGNWLNKSMYKCNKATLNTHNLEDKINTIKRYDIALSLEVAEHLSAKRAHSFVEELCNIANIVLFSAAIPGQGGTHHINEQWQSYWVKKFNEIGINNLMLDLKLNDIPITIKRAILALKEVKFGYLTVMSLGGNEMIKEAKEAAHEIDPNIKILAVTVLTSLSKNQLSEMGFNLSVEETVLKLAKNSNDADGYVCSALEAKLLRKEFPNKLILCPGLRLPDDSKNDQKRIATPAQAIQNGADVCIMGRSLLKGDINKNI